MGIIDVAVKALNEASKRASKPKIIDKGEVSTESGVKGPCICFGLFRRLCFCPLAKDVFAQIVVTEKGAMHYTYGPFIGKGIHY